MTDLRKDRRTVRQLMAAAAKDTDAASVFYNGSGPADYDSAIVVIKGRENVDYVVAMLARQQLFTPGKPVEGSTIAGVAAPDGQTFHRTDARDAAAGAQKPDKSESAVSAPSERELLERAGTALDGLMTWCAENVDQWDFPQYDEADRTIAAIRAHLGDKT